jgi:hypothetical protein
MLRHQTSFIHKSLPWFDELTACIINMKSLLMLLLFLLL